MAVLTLIGPKGGTLRGTTAHGYRIALPTSKVFVTCYSKTGTFWIKPFSPSDQLPGVDPTNAVIPANDTTTDHVELKDGDIVSWGVSSSEGVRSLPGGGGPIVQLEVWCELAGDLILVLQ
jgi:hypothetical protein